MQILRLVVGLSEADHFGDLLPEVGVLAASQVTSVHQARGMPQLLFAFAKLNVAVPQLWSRFTSLYSGIQSSSF